MTYNWSDYRNSKVFFYGMVQLSAHYILCYRNKLLTRVDYLVCLEQIVLHLLISLVQLEKTLSWGVLVSTILLVQSSCNRTVLLADITTTLVSDVKNPSICQKRHIGLPIDTHSTLRTNWPFVLLVLLHLYRILLD